MQYLANGGRFGHHVGHRFGEHGGRLWFVLGDLVVWLAFAALVALIVLAVLRLSGRHRGQLVAAAGPSRPDEALTQVRLRYSRGEVSREDFVRMSADLGSPVTPTDDPPPAAT